MGKPKLPATSRQASSKTRFDRAELDRRLTFPCLMGMCRGCVECSKPHAALKLTLAVLDAAVDIQIIEKDDGTVTCDGLDRLQDIVVACLEAGLRKI